MVPFSNDVSKRGSEDFVANPVRIRDIFVPVPRVLLTWSPHRPVLTQEAVINLWYCLPPPHSIGPVFGFQCPRPDKILAIYYPGRCDRCHRSFIDMFIEWWHIKSPIWHRYGPQSQVWSGNPPSRRRTNSSERKFLRFDLLSQTYLFRTKKIRKVSLSIQVCI
jgi:hypothetical protein